MKNTGKRLLFIIILCTLMISNLPIKVSANSAEPPSIVILVNNPPKDLSIELVSGKYQAEGKQRRVAWEEYYVFYSRDLMELQKSSAKSALRVTTNGESFELIIKAPMQSYNNVFTLNVKNRVLTPGKYPFRQALLVSIRVLLTLIIEGMIFGLFRFRQKRSWFIFLVVNLVTQGVLNIWLNNGGSVLPSYLIFNLIIGEIFVFIAEIIALPRLINEHDKKYNMIYTFIANLISFIAGGYIITVLPV